VPAAAAPSNASAAGPRNAVTAPPDADQVRAIFDAPAPFTVGIEEELMLLDPDTLDLAPVGQQLKERVADDGRFKIEMPAAQFEIASPPLRDAAHAREFLHTARADLAQAAEGLAKLACAGVHPFGDEEGELNASERYKRVHQEYGRIARRQLAFGLQVHVAVRPAAAALKVYNGLREHLPELLALAANSPIYRGVDTGLAAVRPKLCELLPRQGVPPHLASWDEYAGALAWGAKAGALPDPGVWWWELRPHPSFGTLEVRVPDAQRTVEEATAIVATVHALATHLAERDEADDKGSGKPIPTWRIEENRWQALRHGLDGTMADLETGAPTATRTRLRKLLDTIEGEHDLSAARKLVQANGATRQRELFEQAGAQGVAEWLTSGFAQTGAGHG
jgi:glutamate---cysteine ligase / carboxylate-amine ligase